MKRNPKVPDIIEEVQQVYKIPRSHLVCDGIEMKYEDMKKGEKLETFFDGKHQTELENNLLPKINEDLTFEILDNMVDAKDVFRLEKKLYQNVEIIRKHIFRMSSERKRRAEIQLKWEEEEEKEQIERSLFERMQYQERQLSTSSFSPKEKAIYEKLKSKYSQSPDTQSSY